MGRAGEPPPNLSGPFTEAQRLIDSGRCERHEIECIQETFEWFNEHLPVPPWESIGRSSHAISWFRSTAVTFVNRMYDLTLVLGEYGIPTMMLRETYLRKLLYEDDYQVVAIDLRY